MNLLQETKKDITTSGHKIKDIIFIGSEDTGHSCTWKEFETLADKEYDSGYGGQEVATDLIIVFRDGMKMWRGEYDGSEWWNFSTPFSNPIDKQPIAELFCHSAWETLEEINTEISRKEKMNERR